MCFKTLLTVKILLIFVLFTHFILSNISIAKGNNNNDREVSEFKAATIEQWSIDNQHQIAQLKEMVKTNQFFDENSKKPNAKQWDKLKEIHKNTLNVLHASHAIADVMEKKNELFISQEKVQAWQKCAQKSFCALQDAHNFFNKTRALQNLEAIKNAKTFKNNINAQIKNLNDMSTESLEAKGLAANLDAMSKINAQTSNSLVDLNSQFATIIEMMSFNNVQKEKKNDMQRNLSYYFHSIEDGDLHMDFSIGNKIR